MKMSDLYGSNESEDMSSFLQILLQNSSSSAAATASAAAGGLYSGGGAAADSSTSCFLARDFGRSRGKNLASSREEHEGSDTPNNLTPSRSSKRSRAAEFHNLSEKRRRSRINEKLKALQTLIPNSNKTDKASMLDEAIEYLKHLQLQVQMLTMRNGLSLHPGYSLGSFGLDLDEGDSKRDEDIYVQSSLGP